MAVMRGGPIASKMFEGIDYKCFMKIKLCEFYLLCIVVCSQHPGGMDSFLKIYDF